MDMLKPFENQKYLNLETFRKNGQAMPSPVWFVQDGEIIYIRTAANSGKVKRVRANPRVNLMPCGVDGEPLGAWTPAIAHETSDEAIFARVRELLLEKYGSMVETYEARLREQGNQYTVLQVEFKPT